MIELTNTVTTGFASRINWLAVLDYKAKETEKTEWMLTIDDMTAADQTASDVDALGYRT